MKPRVLLRLYSKINQDLMLQFDEIFIDLHVLRIPKAGILRGFKNCIPGNRLESEGGLFSSPAKSPTNIETRLA